MPRHSHRTGAGPRRRTGAGPRQTSLARIREFGVTPKRALGQNFLVDDNILRLILDRLRPRGTDCVIEVGGGLGVLTEALAAATAHVHVFEIDESLEAPLRRTIGENPGVTLHFADVMQAELEALLPEPTLCASNLPYSVAAPFLAESVWRLPAVRRYVVMTQREVADRLMASPGTRTYAGVSAWVQLHVQFTENRPLSRDIFYPRPNVDSSLLIMERHHPDPLVSGRPREVKSVIDAAFSQRRKALANSLTDGLGLKKAVVVGLIEAAGIDPGVRAEVLAPEDFVRLAKAVLETGPRRV